MAKEKGPNHELERYSRGRLQSLLSQWVLNSLDEDYAFDFEVRPTEGVTDSHAVTPAPFYAQLKASRQFDDAEYVWKDFDTEYLLDDCLQATVPVFLFVYERHSDECYWCVLQEYCWDVLDEERPDWRDQSQVRVKLDRDSSITATGIPGIRTADLRTHRRISTRAHLASAHRDTLFAQPGTSFASTEQVGAHKADIVDEAQVLADAGHEDRALRKLMDVYRMPGRDEPTLLAIGELVDRRETDDPSIAFAKIRLAREGRRLAEALDRPDLHDWFDDRLETAWTYVDETFLGGRYAHETEPPTLQVLDVVDWDLDANGAGILAKVQYGAGDFDEENAQGLADSDDWNRIEPGDGRTPSEDACANREHDFDTDALRRAPGVARCSDCGLSGETIRNWLRHEVPEVCTDCGNVSYETSVRLDSDACSDRVLCPDCQ